MRPGPCILAAAGVATIIAGCASGARHEVRRYERLLSQTAQSFRHAEDADSLAVAALLSARRDPLVAAELVGRAVAMEPLRPELAFLHVAICAKAPGCDLPPIEARLRALDPGNGAGWLGAIDRAHQSGDAAALERSLTGLAAAKTVRSYWTTLIARLSAAVERAQKAPPEDTTLLLVGELAVHGLPGIVGVSHACSTERTTEEGTLAACRAISSALMAGDTVIAESIGASLAMRSWPSDSPEWRAAWEARRAYRYRSRALSRAQLAADDQAADAREVIELAALYVREQDLLLAQLQRRGIDPLPPEDWRDPTMPDGSM